MILPLRGVGDNSRNKCATRRNIRAALRNATKPKAARNVENQQAPPDYNAASYVVCDTALFCFSSTVASRLQVGLTARAVRALQQCGEGRSQC